MSEAMEGLIISAVTLLILPALSAFYVLCATKCHERWALWCALLGLYLSLELEIARIRQILAGEVPGMGKAAAVILSVLLTAVWAGVYVFYRKTKKKYAAPPPPPEAAPPEEEDAE